MTGPDLVAIVDDLFAALDAGDDEALVTVLERLEQCRRPDPAPDRQLDERAVA